MTIGVLFIKMIKHFDVPQWLQFLPKPYMLSHDISFLHKHLALCWVWSSFVTLVERFIMLPRSRSLARLINLLLLHWKYAETCLHFHKVHTPCFSRNSLSSTLLAKWDIDYANLWKFQGHPKSQVLVLVGQFKALLKKMYERWAKKFKAHRKINKDSYVSTS